MIGDFVKSFKISKVAKNFIIADLILFGGWGLVSPIMAIFIIDEVRGASLVTVGLMAAIYWAVRSSIELPMATVIEKTKSEKDDLYVLILGLLLVSIAAFWLTIVKTVPQLFTNQAIKALGFAFYAASWSGIFSRHIDKNKAARSWSIDHTALGIDGYHRSSRRLFCRAFWFRGHIHNCGDNIFSVGSYSLSCAGYNISRERV
jgi:hypothetical protein